ncbi:MAG TPA: M13 family metallopeptidase [Candidatus Acidoferrales bacterium]|nr:M13 family metallopeptidase [Candidatus Acidoferrales bacterium]
MKINHATPYLLFISFAIGIGVTEMMAQEKTESILPLDPANLDTTASPRQNFYLYANGGWLKRNPIPPEYSRWGSFTELYDRNMEQLHGIVDSAAAETNAAKGSDVQLVGDFFYSGMDSSNIELQGMKPLEKYLKKIDAVKDLKGLQKIIPELQRFGVNILFYFSSQQDFKNSETMIATVRQAGLGLPDRDYYTKTDPQSQQILQEYNTHLINMFELLGDNEKKSGDEAQVVMKLERRLAEASMTRTERRDPKATYNMMALAKVNALTPEFSWNAYLRYFSLPKVKSINIAQPKFVKEIGKILKQISIKDWKVYVRWHLIHSMAPYISKKYVDENFRFYGTVLTGAKELQPRWKRVLNTVDNEIGFSLGKLYVKDYFSPEAKARAEEMVRNLEATLAERIKKLDWMSDETKKQALTKLNAIINKIGYPDKWKSYEGLQIDRGTYVMNVMRANEFDFNFEIGKIGKPVDRTEWGMTPPTVNAYYNPSMNEIVFPAGILQPPFFNPIADDAVNYGGMGAVIGHEMTHGFDDQGSQFDAKGNLENWWTESDATNFKKKAEVLVNQFNSYTVLDSIHVNGKLTEGENIADLGGVSIAYDAFENTLKDNPRPGTIDGFTAEQRFFLAWAQMWRENDTPQALRQRIIVDPHSPNEYRCNGPLSDTPAFYEAFGCKPGDPMYRSEDERAKIW